MRVTSLHKDVEAATFAIVVEYSATADQVWELWSNPRLLERWWGPPSHPATVTSHDFSPGGVVRYYMTGPEGDRYHGGWRVVSMQPPHRLELEDFFADDEGNEDTSLPVSSTVVAISEQEDGIIRMSIDTRYPTPEALRQVIEMGMEEGIQAALGQTEALLVGQLHP